VKSVYLIRGNNGRYKIGIAKNPSQRIKTLQTGNSDRLQLIETYQSENASKIESTLHNHFGHVRKEGEWFDLSISEEVNFKEKCGKIDASILLLQKMNNPFL
jgi:hypothetical protein